MYFKHIHVVYKCHSTIITCTCMYSTNFMWSTTCYLLLLVQIPVHTNYSGMINSAVFRILWRGGDKYVSGNEGGGEGWGAKPPSLCVSTCKARGFWKKILHIVEAQSSFYMHS